jgi:hypothetical protein
MMIKQKRESLVRFIREQLIGPGGCADRYSVCHEEAEKQEECYMFGEVLNTSPGSIYSSAILFPRQGKQGDASDEESLSQDDSQNMAQGMGEDMVEEDESGDSTNTDNGSDDDQVTEERNFDHSEDIDSLERRFPNKFGISCCLDEMKANDDLQILVSGRYYLKLKEYSRLRIKIDDVEGFTTFIQDTNVEKLIGKVVALEGNYIKLIRKISAKEYRPIREGIREVNKYLCEKVATNKDGSLCPIYSESSFNKDYKFLSAYKERLFSKLNYVDNGNYPYAGREQEICNRIASVEMYETYLSYIEDAVSMFDPQGFGYWEAVDFSKKIDLSGIDLCSQRIFKAEDFKELKDVVKVELSASVTLALDIWLQAIKKAGKLYLKVLLVNNSTPVNPETVKYFSIVTEKVNQRSFFGVSIDISSPNLQEYHKVSSYDAADQEANKLKFLYRSIKDYGVGHLCSADWGEKDGVMHVWSEFLPSVESPDVEPVPRNKEKEYKDKDGKFYAEAYLKSPVCLQFKWLSVFSATTDKEIVTELLDFVESYHRWIQNLPTESNEIALSNQRECEHDYYRMRSNIIDFLNDNDKMLAFRLMNAAMFMQLWHNVPANKQKVRMDKKSLTFDYYRDEADDTSIFKGIKAAWRPFQLAFILLNLDGIFQRDATQPWRERNELVDLVWFPTGGGKTEAYLGIIALTIINRRRLYGREGYGTAALMRYTLRLLTTQQFQRALRLIMALEQIRQWKSQNYGLGDSEISIGLYVGSASLPNSDRELAEIAKKWNTTHGQVPLDVCPWCGSEIRPVKIAGEQHFQCDNERCTFSGMKVSYPVRLCDEQLYKNPPTLLFGTVDKFAQLAHRVDENAAKDSRRLFRGDGCLPPDLIIQDELHLLLGPLGSAVSLYECAIDQLCSYHDNQNHLVRPKIISSTATTRNTSLQIRALYDRGVSIFPKNGVDYDDSFFAFYKRYKEEGGSQWKYIAKRKYIGVLPTGRTHMTTQIRLASIVFVHRALFELENEDKLGDKEFQKAADYYYTLISYFNSLKEVGKTDAQFYQEFTKYTRRLFKRVLRFTHMLECHYIYADHFRKSELTGRLSGEEAVKELANVQNMQWDPAKRLPFKDGDGNWQYATLPADMILATNMISVGLDVARFNTIMMNSMPRNIAEYIQASSRVARESEGLVITLHNPFSQRDVSHFEKFREFHEKMYYYVEPISITPFSPKSIERFLPLCLAAYIRQSWDKLGGRKDACNMNESMAKDIKKVLKSYFTQREQRAENLPQQEAALLTPAMLKIVFAQIDKCLDIWLESAQRSGQNLVYYISQFGRTASTEKALFASPEDYEGEVPSDKWLVPNALRVIEPESVIHVIH